MEKICSSLKGIYRDILKDRCSRVIFDSGWISNKIVDRCRILLAAFMKNDQNTQTRGIQCLKVGKGDPSWDDNGAEAPKAGEEALVDPDPFVIDVSKLEIIYLNEQDAEVNEPTSRLQITVKLEADEPPPPDPNLTSYPLREFGLFGVYVDNSGVEHEYMIDCIRHPVIHKDASTTLVRVVRLYF